MPKELDEMQRAIERECLRDKRKSKKECERQSWRIAQSRYQKKDRGKEGR